MRYLILLHLKYQLFYTWFCSPISLWSIVNYWDATPNSFLFVIESEYGSMYGAFTLDAMQIILTTVLQRKILWVLSGPSYPRYQEFLPRLHALCTTETDGQTLRITNPPLGLVMKCLEDSLFLRAFQKKGVYRNIWARLASWNARMRIDCWGPSSLVRCRVKDDYISHALGVRKAVKLSLLFREVETGIRDFL